MGNHAGIRESAPGATGQADDRDYSPGANQVGNSGAYPDGFGEDCNP